MKIKKGDKVKLIAGKDKGKIGKVLQVFQLRNLASIEGLNILIKHMRPSKQGEKGQRVEFPAPMNLSNMMLVCSKCSKPTTVGYKYVESGEGDPATFAGASGRAGKKKKKKFRICKKCDQTID